MSWLFKMLPSWMPLVLGGLLLAGIVAGYFAWTYHQREIGRQEIIAKDAKALAEQKEKDAALSANLVAELREAIDRRDRTAQPVREVIRRDATPCAAATGADAAAVEQWMRSVLPQAREPDARR